MPARDFKRIGEGDSGPNTGGMGAFSPVSQVDDKLIGVVMDTGIEPTLAADVNDGPRRALSAIPAGRANRAEGDWDA